MKKSYEETAEEEIIHGHHCRGQQLRPWNMLLCSNCRGPQDGSYDVIISRKKLQEYKEIDKKVGKLKGENAIVSEFLSKKRSTD